MSEPKPLRIDLDGQVSFHDGRMWHHWDPTWLINNLAIAGALCAAFRLGIMSCSCDGMWRHRDWRPGCGWPVGDDAPPLSEPHDFEGEHADCVLCGEGSQHYLHSPEPCEDA